MKAYIHYSLIATINAAVFHLRCKTEHTLWNKDSSPSEKQFECTHKDLVGLWLTLRASYLWNIIPSKIFPIRPEQIQSPPFFSWLEAPGEKFWLIRTLAWKVAVKIWTTGHWPTNSLRKVNAQIGPLEIFFPGSDSSMTSPPHLKYWYSLAFMWISMLSFMNVPFLWKLRMATVKWK